MQRSVSDLPAAFPSLWQALEDRPWLASATVIGALVAAAFSPAALVVEYGGAVACATIILTLIRVRRWIAAFELTLWLWITAPELRRVVDAHTRYHQTSLTLLVAPVAAIALLAPVLWVRSRVWRDVAIAVAVTVGLFCYATAIGLVQVGVTATAAGAGNWIPPLATGVAALVIPVSAAEIRASLLRFATAASAALGIYGIIQWAVLPSWDADWMINVADTVTSIGSPEPRMVRVFSLSNSPGPASAALLVLLLVVLSIPRQTLYTAVASISALITLGLTEVRQSWIAGGIAVGLLLARRVLPLTRVLVTVLVLSALAAVYPAASQVITQRFSSSVQAGSSDESLDARLSFQAKTVPLELTDYFGHGLGSTGAGVRVSGASQDDDAFANTDSGYLEILRNLGSVGSALLLMVLLPAFWACWRRSRGDSLATALAALLLTVPVQLLFGNVFVGTTGAFVWLVFGMLGRPKSRPDIVSYHRPLPSQAAVSERL